MILLDTHVWVWWMTHDPRLTGRLQARFDGDRSDRLGVSVISCWEVAQLVSKQRIGLDRPTYDWIQSALNMPRVELVAFGPDIAVEANELPEPFHRDPADRILVATARLLRVPLLTADAKILDYPHVPLA